MVGTSIVTAAIVSSRPPPPPLVVEEPPPRAGYVWQPGYWSLEHDEWVDFELVKISVVAKTGLMSCQLDRHIEDVIYIGSRARSVLLCQ